MSPDRSTTYDRAHALETIFSSERARLLQMFLTCTGDIHAAEDLVQETLTEAWRQRQKIYDPNGLSAWLSRIAHNMFLRWTRARGRILARTVELSTHAEETGPREEELLDDFDIEIVLEHKELSELLDRALALLPSETREMLLQRYVEESSLADIARLLSIHPSAATMRLQRGKLALRRVLMTHMREEIAPYLLSSTSLEWQETATWCFLCGQHRLKGKCLPEEKRFVLTCPLCCPRSEAAFSYPLDVFPCKGSKLSHAVSQANTKFGDYYQGIRSSQRCFFCGHEVVSRMDIPPLTLSEREASMVRWWYQHGRRFFYTRCTSCNGEVLHALENLILNIPQVKKFWHENPKIRFLPAKDVDVAGSPALVTTMKSLTSQMTLTVITPKENFAASYLEK